MFHIPWDFDSEHELGPIEAWVISVDHGSHTPIILEEISSPLPCRVFGQTFLDSVVDQRIRVLDP